MLIENDEDRSLVAIPVFQWELRAGAAPLPDVPEDLVFGLFQTAPQGLTAARALLMRRIAMLFDHYLPVKRVDRP